MSYVSEIACMENQLIYQHHHLHMTTIALVNQLDHFIHYNIPFIWLWSPDIIHIVNILCIVIFSVFSDYMHYLVLLPKIHIHDTMIQYFLK